MLNAPLRAGAGKGAAYKKTYWMKSVLEVRGAVEAVGAEAALGQAD